MSAPEAKYQSVDFEVHGKVQKVFFRKYTKRTADSHKLVGWVMNTDQATVVGTVQGPRSKVTSMRDWLRKTGSPKSKITKCVFTNERKVAKLEFKTFDIRESRP